LTSIQVSLSLQGRSVHCTQLTSVPIMWYSEPRNYSIRTIFYSSIVPPAMVLGLPCQYLTLRTPPAPPLNANLLLFMVLACLSGNRETREICGDSLKFQGKVIPRDDVGPRSVLCYFSGHTLQCKDILIFYEYSYRNWELTASDIVFFQNSEIRGGFM